MSVAFRTALLQALALPTDEADPDSQTYVRDNHQGQAPPPQQQRAENPNAISKAQLGKIGALMGELKITARDDALAYVADVIGRPVQTRNELSKSEASKLIEALAAEVDASKAGVPA